MRIPVTWLQPWSLLLTSESSRGGFCHVTSNPDGLSSDQFRKRLTIQHLARNTTSCSNVSKWFPVQFPNLKARSWEFPGDPMVTTWRSGLGSTPDQGTEIPQAAQCSPKWINKYLRLDPKHHHPWRAPRCRVERFYCTWAVTATGFHPTCLPTKWTIVVIYATKNWPFQGIIFHSLPQNHYEKSTNFFPFQGNETG